MEGWMPRYLDSPLQFMWFELDEVLPAIALCALGLFIGPFLPFMLAGFASAWGIVKMKKNMPVGFTGNVAYMLGLKKIKGCPSYFANKFIE